MKLDREQSGTGKRSEQLDRADVLAAYGRYANIYDLIFGAIFEPGRRAAVAAVNTGPGQRILEVGVGTGLSLPLYRADARVVGIDLSPDMLAKARRRVAELALAQVEALHEMDALDMQLDDASFDAVVVMYTVSVVSDLERLFAEIRRVCVADGEIVVLSHFASSGLLPSLVERLMAPFSAAIGFRPDVQQADVVRRAEIKVLEARKVNLFGYWTLLRFRNAP